MGLEKLGTDFSPITAKGGTDFDNLKGFTAPTTTPAAAATKQAAITVAPLSSYLAKPESPTAAVTKPTPAVKAETTADTTDPIVVDFGTGLKLGTTQVATSVGSTATAATASGTATVSDSARATAKSSLAAIDAKLAANGYSKTIGNQRDRTDAVNAVVKGLSGDAKTKFLAELKTLSAPLGLNFGRPELDGGKAQFDKLGTEQQAINRELYEEWKTGKVATPTAAPAAKTPTVTPAAEKKEKPQAAAIEVRPRSTQVIDRLNDLKNHDEAYAIAWAKSMRANNSERVDGGSVVTSGDKYGVHLAVDPDVAKLLKANPTAEEFGRAMYKLANQ